MFSIPYVIEKTSNGERSYDLDSRLMKERIIQLSHEINDDVAKVVCAQLLFLESEDPDAEIMMYINSPGGSVSAGAAIFDTMKLISCPVHTFCMGTCASMGAFLFAAGDERTVLPSAKVMIHQPMGGIQPGTQASDMKITCEQIQKTKMWLNSCLAEFTGQPLDIIEQDTDRDHWLNAQEAVDYGLADNIATSRKKK